MKILKNVMFNQNLLHHGGLAGCLHFFSKKYFHKMGQSCFSSIIVITAPSAQDGNLEWKPSGMLNKNTIYHSLTNPALLWGKKTQSSHTYLAELSTFGFCQWYLNIVREKQIIFQGFLLPCLSSHLSLKVRRLQGRLLPHWQPLPSGHESCAKKRCFLEVSPTL